MIYSIVDEGYNCVVTTRSKWLFSKLKDLGITVIRTINSEKYDLTLDNIIEVAITRGNNIFYGYNDELEDSNDWLLKIQVHR